MWRRYVCFFYRSWCYSVVIYPCAWVVSLVAFIYWYRSKHESRWSISSIEPIDIFAVTRQHISCMKICIFQLGYSMLIFMFTVFSESICDPLGSSRPICHRRRGLPGWDEAFRHSIIQGRRCWHVSWLYLVHYLVGSFVAWFVSIILSLAFIYNWSCNLPGQCRLQALLKHTITFLTLHWKHRAWQVKGTSKLSCRQKNIYLLEIFFKLFWANGLREEHLQTHLKYIEHWGWWTPVLIWHICRCVCFLPTYTSSIIDFHSHFVLFQVLHY